MATEPTIDRLHRVRWELQQARDILEGDTSDVAREVRGEVDRALAVSERWIRHWAARQAERHAAEDPNA